MTMLRRMLAVGGLLAVIAVISSSSDGGDKPDTGASPQQPPAAGKPAAPKVNLYQAAEAIESRFQQSGVLTYASTQGDHYIALQLQPKLDAVPARPRDILILVSTSANQAGAGWIAAQQIMNEVVKSAKANDRVCVWKINDNTPATQAISNGFVE